MLLLPFFLLTTAGLWLRTMPRLDVLALGAILAGLGGAIVGPFLIDKQIDRWMFLVWSLLPLLFIVPALLSERRQEGLSGMMNSRDGRVRMRAVRKAAWSPKRGLMTLHRGAKDEMQEIRLVAVRALSLVHDSLAISDLREAFSDSAPEIREQAKASLRGATCGASEAWIAEMDRLSLRKAGNQRTWASFVAPPLPSLASKIVASTLGGGVGALSMQWSRLNLQLPQTCSLCGINAATTEIVAETDLTTSVIGMAIGGPLLGRTSVQLPVRVCEPCRNMSDLAPCVELWSYREEHGQWQVRLSFLNDHVAEQFQKANSDRVVRDEVRS